MERNYSDDVQNPKEKEKAEMLHRVLMERIKNGENPYKGSVVKSRNYVYQEEARMSKLESGESVSREDKINEILAKISPHIQEDVNNLIEAQKRLEEEKEALQRRLEEVLKINAPQTRVDKDKAKGEER